MAKYTKAKLKKLDGAQLNEVAMSEFGIVVADDWDDDRVINEILEAQTVEQERELEEQASATDGRKVKFIIHNGEGVNGKSDVFFSHNGRQYLAKRNKELILPEAHLSALTDAITTVYEDEADENGKVIARVPRNVPRFNAQILGYVD